MSKPRRVLLIVLALVGAAGFAVAVQGGRWWSYDTLHVGPTGAWWCTDGDCHKQAWSSGTELWQRMAFATYAGGMVAALVLVGLAGAVAAGRASRTMAWFGASAIATATACGAAFFALRPDLSLPVSVGRGVPLFALGAVAGAVVVAMLARAPRPALSPR